MSENSCDVEYLICPSLPITHLLKLSVYVSPTRFVDGSSLGSNFGLFLDDLPK